MKTISALSFILAAFIAANAAASTHYVDLNCTNPVAPYTSWTTAATNIQPAVDAAVSGETVLVTNGVYSTGGRRWFDSGTNRVTLTNSIILQSVNGPAVTFIVGHQVVGGGTVLTNAARCVGMGNNAVLSGFTLTNGSGGWGNYPYGGGVANIVSGSSTVTNCVLIGNLSPTAFYGGGGAYRVKLINCQLIGNQAGYGGGACACELVNCLVASNTASYGGGVFGNTTFGVSALTNCTIVGNSATNSGGGVNNSGSSAMDNCIVYYNTAPAGSNYTGIKLNYCCTTPLLAGDLTSISNAPMFVNSANGNFRLLPGSPCINAGGNSYAPVGTDLDGNPRIVSSVVDMGAYESQFTAPLRFVNLNNTNPVAPFTNWLAAATNIQDAIDVSIDGDLVLVTNGVYAFGGKDVYGSNRVAITKAITVQSLNGYGVTTILGMTNGVNVRCAYLTNGAALIGFTLTNGSPTGGFSGGGVTASSLNTTISNCLIIQNIAPNGSGGGASGGTFYNCIISQNSANGGGGVFAATLYNCIVSSNSAGNGGGCYSGSVHGSLVTGNQAGNGGGGYNSGFFNCVITSNTATGSFGGGAAYQTTLESCTVIGNRCTSFNGGFCGGALNGNSYNCILYYNTSLSHSTTPNYSGGLQVSCCTTPQPLGDSGNFSFAPLLADPGNGDFHLQSNSPCINSGNNSYASGSTDLDGNPRITGSAIDVGAYEYQSPASMLSYAWAQQYGFATDGSADDADSDNDGMSNWQEWMAGTNPTNAVSVLMMNSPSNNVSDVIVTWQSVSGRNYFIQRASDLTASPAFSAIESNIVGQAGTTTYTDTTATNGGPYFYRVGVQ